MRGGGVENVCLTEKLRHPFMAVLWHFLNHCFHIIPFLTVDFMAE